MKLRIMTAGALSLALAACNPPAEETVTAAEPAPVEVGEATSVETEERPLDIDCTKADSTIELNHCADQKLQAAKAELKKYTEQAYADLREYPSENTEAVIAAIQASDKSYEDYVIKACDEVSKQWEGGSIGGLMYLNCQRDLIVERTHFIWRTHSISMEGYAKLPEPKRLEVRYKLDTDTAG